MSYHSLFNLKSLKEFQKVPIRNIYGKIPEKLRGTLYRNSAVLSERNGQTLSHWFDGDGAILKIDFKNSQVEASYKFVETKAFKKESEAGRFIFPNIANTGFTFFDKLRYGFLPANRANTSVLPLENKKLLALWEGGWPHALDSETLHTYGEDNLGFLNKWMKFSAHHKVDPDTGFIYNIGQRGNDFMMDIYKCDQTGQIFQHNGIRFDRNPNFIHDFCLAGDYLVFFTFPITMNLFPLTFQKKSFFESLEYDPSSYSEIVIVSKKTLELVATLKHDAFFTFHYANGFTTNEGNIIVDLCAYKNLDVFKSYTKDIIKEPLENKQAYKSSKALLTRFEIDLSNKKLLSRKELSKEFCEFPVVYSSQVGKKYSNVFMVSSEEEKNYSEYAMRLNINKEQVIRRKFGDLVYPSEILHIENPDYLRKGINEDDSNNGWGITVTYDANKNKNFVHIMDENTLEDVAVFELPSLVAHGFHGTWQSKTNY